MADAPASFSGRISLLVSRVIAWVLQRKIVRAFLHYSEHRGAMLADSVTYRALFSVFAGVLLGFSVAGLWLAGNTEAWNALIDAVDTAIPGLVGRGGLIDPDSIVVPAGLTLAGIISLIGLVGAAIGAITSLRLALRILADRVADDTFFLWVLLRNFALALGFGLALALSAAATFLGTALLGTLGDWLGVAHDSPALVWGARSVSIAVTFVLDTVVVAAVFVVLAGVRVRFRTLCGGALLGGVGLTVLQQLSGWFVGGASSNPLLASFASLIALLLWFNLSAQTILLASSYIVVGREEDEDRVRSRHGVTTFAQRRVQRAERSVQVASDELALARELAEKERDKAASRRLEKEDAAV